MLATSSWVAGSIVEKSNIPEPSIVGLSDTVINVPLRILTIVITPENSTVPLIVIPTAKLAVLLTVTLLDPVVQVHSRATVPLTVQLTPVVVSGSFKLSPVWYPVPLDTNWKLSTAPGCVVIVATKLDPPLPPISASFTVTVSFLLYPVPSLLKSIEATIPAYTGVPKVYSNPLPPEISTDTTSLAA